MSIYDSRLILIYCCVLAGILGAVMGSFLNCAAWRIAHSESFIRGHSRCPSCGHSLGVLDLIPVLSWIFLGGKCRYCGKRVSFRYPATELFFALATVLCLLRFDLTVTCLCYWVFLCCLFCLSLVDLEAYIIPDGCLLIALGAWLLHLPFSGMTWKDIGMHALAGVVFCGGILLFSLLMDKLLHRESLGGGDVKLFGVVGLYLGFAGTLFAVMLSCFLGLIFALARRLSSGKSGQIPFGPSIAAAAAVILLYGSPLIAWYLGLIGSA